MFARWEQFVPRTTIAGLFAIAAMSLASHPAHAEPPKENAKPASKIELEASKPAVKPKVAVFHINGAVTETAPDETFSFSPSTAVSLRDLLGRIKKAGEDSQVKALVLVHEGASVGSAQIEEIRQALAAFRKTGKEVYASSDSLTMHDYALLSGATRLSVVPTADLWITGLYGEAPYLRGLLNRIGVKPDFLTCGAYKSAAEIFLREGPSPEAEAMQNWLLDGLFAAYVDLIAQGRGVEPARVREWIDAGPFTAEKAKAAGLVDAVEHRQDLEEYLKHKYGADTTFDKKYGQKQALTLDMSSPFGFLKLWSELLGETKKKSTKPAVGIVYVEGAISLGSGQVSPFGSEGAFSSKIRKALDEAARDDAIKAVVLRVNSPGGSAVASEIILDATRRVKAKKPFTVSMGNVAGSGGYYVACASDLIFADASTITASIGVVGGKLSTANMWKSVGVTFKAYKRGENAGMLASSSGFTAEERTRMETWMNDVYGVFKGHVQTIRGNRLKKPIDELAGGRVFTGRQALELGLVDKIGTLQDAVAHVAKEAKLTDYDVRVVPASKSFFEQLVEESSGRRDEGPGIGLGTRLPARRATDSLIELAMPFLRNLDPARVDAVKSALLSLQMLHEERVILVMPELGLPR